MLPQSESGDESVENNAFYQKNKPSQFYTLVYLLDDPMEMGYITANLASDIVSSCLISDPISVAKENSET